MLINFNYFDNLVLLYTYMFVYNISLFLVFWVFQQFISTNFKTIYSFSDFKFNNFFIFLFTIVFFSLAGVPPFLGFFSKLLILILLLNSNFFFFYCFFFLLLFFGLYFYLQNIRYLHSTGINNMNYAHSINVRLSTLFFFFSFSILFFLIFGFFFFDEIILYFNWIFF